MRPFSALTLRGQISRLRQMACAALERYDLPVRRVRSVANHLNAIFRVDTVDHRTFALRISHPTWRTARDLASELAWLRALRRDTDVGAPAPLPARDGTLVVEVALPSVPEPRRCVVMSWIPGIDLAERLSEPNLFKLGILAARLHENGASFRPPADFTDRRMDGLYVRSEPDALLGEDSREFFTPQSRAAYVEVIDRVERAFAALYADPQGLRVIHNDLHHENVRVFRGRLFPFDFEDVLWGYPVQDIAMTCFDLLDYTDAKQTDYLALRKAFERGYASRLPWPETYPGQIDTFIASRQVWRANWVVRFHREHAARHIEWMASRFRRFLDTGSFPR